MDSYYCPGCGTRYSHAGECMNEHAPIPLERLDLSSSPAPTKAADTPKAAGTPAKAPRRIRRRK